MRLDSWAWEINGLLLCLKCQIIQTRPRWESCPASQVATRIPFDAFNISTSLSEMISQGEACQELRMPNSATNSWCQPRSNIDSATSGVQKEKKSRATPKRKLLLFNPAQIQIALLPSSDVWGLSVHLNKRPCCALRQLLITRCLNPQVSNWCHPKIKSSRPVNTLPATPDGAAVCGLGSFKRCNGERKGNTFVRLQQYRNQRPAYP